MKKLTKVISTLALPVLFAACGKGGKGVPQINGVSDKVVKAGTEFNAMEGVSAKDKEDGNLTKKIIIDSTPSLDFVNGKATPSKAGSYEITYTVTDKDGNETSEYSTLTVTKQTGALTLYKEFDFSKKSEINDNGWKANFADAKLGNAELAKGAYVFNIKNPGDGDGAVQLSKAGMETKKADYRIKVWAKSTTKTYCHLLAVDAEAKEWKTFGGAYNVVIDKDVAPLEMNFSCDKKGKANILINLGKITPNPDNLADTTPENFTVTIDKIEVYEITGNETKEPVYTCNFDKAEKTVSVEAGDGANASVDFSDCATVAISSYPTNGGVWSIKTNIGIGNEAIAGGTKYYYSFDVTADSNQSGECLVESASKYDKMRANFAGFSVEGGKKTTVSGVFVAGSNVTDPVIRLQIGNPSDGVTANKLKIDNVVFGKVTGDLATNKTINMFASYGACSGRGTDKSMPWTTYNGTDEDNDRGVGTIYNENGKLYYRIDQAGITDWHNKLICGYGDSPLVLEADKYYTVEITAKADKNVSCSFFLNPMGGWDPRIAEGMDITTSEKTFTFKTKDTFITDMNFEMLFQFGSEATSKLGDVTVEFSNFKIYSESIVD